MQIEYKKKAIKYINSCDKPTKQRLKESIERLPLGDVTKLQGLESEYRLRVGELRVLFTLENDIILKESIRFRAETKRTAYSKDKLL